MTAYTVTARATDRVTGLSAQGTASFTVHSSQVMFGTNQNQLASVAPYVAPMTILRSFKSLADGWPVLPAGYIPHWSIRPHHDDLMAGNLDAEIITALKLAPAHSLLTAYHEPELDSAVTIPIMADINNYMIKLVHKTTSNVRFGPVITAHASADWCIPGMDFYGVDSYDWAGFADPANELSTWSARMPPGPRVVAETNTFKPGKRPAWFTGIYQWLKANHGIAMMTFWNPNGSLSGPFLPADTATIATLNSIAADASAPSSGLPGGGMGRALP